MRGFGAFLLVVLAICQVGRGAETKVQQQSREAYKLLGDGNYAEALAVYEEILPQAGCFPEDLERAVRCLQSLRRFGDFNRVVEMTVAAHPDEWKMLRQAADSYSRVQHWGFMVAGEFERGNHRGGGKRVNATERDQVRAMQLMRDALAIVQALPADYETSRFCQEFARMVLATRGGRESWRLQLLTDLDAPLPDYAEGYHGYGRGGQSAAPVDVDGNPVLYGEPESFEEAASDGERWRWLLAEGLRRDEGQFQRIYSTLAGFHLQQFGVQTMRQYGYFFSRTQPADGSSPNPFDLQSLGDGETMAKLATGVKRFQLPAEHNFTALYQQVADNRKSSEASSAMETLAGIYQNRRQYDKAAAMWRRVIKGYGPGSSDYRKKQLDQIVGNWGVFEPFDAQPKATGATFDFRFRNATGVSFEARPIDEDKLLEMVMDYIRSNPKEFDWQRANALQIGRLLAEGKAEKLLGDAVATWSLKLDPPAGHLDRRVTVSSPLQQAGAYWVTAKVGEGNTTHAVVWVADMVIAQKPSKRGAYYFVADSVTGAPVAGADLQLFGYDREYKGRRRYTMHTRNLAEKTDANGLFDFEAPTREKNNRYNWLVMARAAGGRLAWLGFNSVWPHDTDPDYNQVRGFVTTDRPVYRPAQTVNFKAWASHARYDSPLDQADYAGKPLVVEVHNPRNEQILTHKCTGDTVGGVDGSLDLADDQMLGVYRVSLIDPQFVDPATGRVIGRRNVASHTFRVEEYKKPEFEVVVTAPTKPVMLGESIEVDVQASYYFGGPVTKGEVTYKVTRQDYSLDWFPYDRWDWLFAPGYWWFTADYAWYPGWQIWGCRAPSPWWWHRPSAQPEIVAEATLPVPADGKLTIPIDTSIAKAFFGDRDHRYGISVEVRDESRRTISGAGQVIVARRPYKVYAWLDSGYHRAGDTLHASFGGRTPDGNPVSGTCKATLFAITYDKEGQPQEKAVQSWELDATDSDSAALQITAAKPGQYRLSGVLSDAEGHSEEGAVVFSVHGTGVADDSFRFNDLELTSDSRSYAAGETATVEIRTAAEGSTVLLFERAAGGGYPKPVVLRLDGKQATRKLALTARDMPNIFVEALTIHDGKVHTAVRQIAVPPEKRVLTVEAAPSKSRYLPGEEATVDVIVTDAAGEPYAGVLTFATYDRALDYIAGGAGNRSLVEAFWSWKRRHNVGLQHSLARTSTPLWDPKAIAMSTIGVFGHLEPIDANGIGDGGGQIERRRKGLSLTGGAPVMLGYAAAPMAAASMSIATEAEDTSFDSVAMVKSAMVADHMVAGDGQDGSNFAQPEIRSNFADTACWLPTVVCDAEGHAAITFTMPENLTAWKMRAYAAGTGGRFGQTEAEAVTAKNLMLRMQAPRFFVERDTLTLSANVHNYLDSAKKVRVVLELEGGQLAPTVKAGPGPDGVTRVSRYVDIPAGGEQRVDWEVSVAGEGEATVRMLALTDEESDAMEQSFPVKVHGFERVESFSASLRGDRNSVELPLHVTPERRPDQSRLQIQASPTLAMAMVDALPYLAYYPYESTDVVLDRFLSAALTRKTLQDLGIDLAAVAAKTANLNAQELGDPLLRAAQWDQYAWQGQQIFDDAAFRTRLKRGVEDISEMQNGDGGWGWFSGDNFKSTAFQTAYVVRGLETAKATGVPITPTMLARGQQWLERYEKEQVAKIKRHPKKNSKRYADNLDALVCLTRAQGGERHAEMVEFLYRDRTQLSPYGNALFALALHRMGDEVEKLAMVKRNLEQFMRQDDENQSAWLEIGNGGGHWYWWHWYGNEMETHAAMLELLAATEPKAERTARLAKYIVNNRKHGVYWSSPRDTARCVAALASFVAASGEGRPDMQVEVALDGKALGSFAFTPETLFAASNRIELAGSDISDGDHTLTITRTGSGPLYINAWHTTFSLQEPIPAAGLEVKVDRTIYKLTRKESTAHAAGARGQAVAQRVETYERTPITDLKRVASGDLLEVELTIESKNDYAHILIEDLKASGAEPVDVRSGGANEMGAYMQLRDDRVTYHIEGLARGKHSLSYRMRAEIPGAFHVLPTRISGVYAPELVGNSDEDRLNITE